MNYENKPAILVFCCDVSQQRKLELQLFQSEKMASIGQLAGGVAHEINNPVGFVISNLNTLREYQQDFEKLITRYREALNEDRQLPLNGGEGLLSQKIGIVDALEREIELECYPQQLNQVFMNLLVNAGQAISGKGEIKIQTRRRNSHVEILFSDTGCGIAQEDLNKIFDPFFTTKPVGKGTGLGLHVSYNIIKKHNGDIRVTSEIGKGTVFAIQLPI